MKKAVFVLIMLIFLVSCVIDDDATKLPTNPVTSPVYHTTETVGSVTSLPTPVISDAIIITVEEQRNCPIHPESRVTDLDMKQTSRLILRNRDEKLYLYGISTDGIQILNIEPSARPTFGIAISPNGQQLVYSAKRDNSYSDLAYEIWLTSLDGRISQALAQVNGVVPKPIWLNENLIAIWGYSKDWLYPHIMFFIKPVDGGVTPLTTPFPELNIMTFNEWPALTNDGTRMIYTDGSSSWFEYNFETRETQTILPWLEDMKIDAPVFAFGWDQQGFSLILPEQDTLFIFENNSVGEWDDSDVIIHQINLPGIVNTEDWWSVIPWWSPDLNQVALDILTPGINLDDFNIYEDIVPTSLYMVDINEQRLTDYCLDRSRLSNGETGFASQFAFVSRDGGFLAWTIYDKASMLPIEIRILELKSGKLVTVDVRGLEVEVVGWGEVPDVDE